MPLLLVANLAPSSKARSSQERPLLLVVRHLFLLALVTTSKALVTRSVALVTTSFLLLLAILESLESTGSTRKEPFGS